ncbi:MAG: RiPP maturation radical SAM protein 1 [Nitrospirae bacterium]|nr:RiPP maturation radical SAM protein 1 [Nitrospirota bacterium]
MKSSNSQIDVALVSMPFFALDVPAMGLSLLKARLTESNISSRVFYFGFLFAEMVGQERYLNVLMDHFRLSDWVFTKALFDDRSRSLEEVIREIKKYLEKYSMNVDVTKSEIKDFVSSRYFKTQLTSAKMVEKKADLFLNKCLKEVLRHKPRIVGFSSTFQQHISSLDLARRIKERAPETYIIFGGANCRGSQGIELLKQFPFIDAVFLGEADDVFPEMIGRVLKKDSVAGLPGVYTRENTIAVSENGCYPSAWVRDLDKLPYPDFDDYFERIKSSPLKLKNNPKLACETARGCWWGKCLFCGMDHANTVYRGKSNKRALDELECLCKKYPTRLVLMTDDVIDMKLFKNFIPGLASRRLDIDLLYEVRANLKKDHVRDLSRARVNLVGCGIESLSTPTLKLMQKGVTAVQNIQLLKWCREMGITVSWNILCGFPGEAPEEYDLMAKLMPLLYHLVPPKILKFHLIRFSVYFDNPKQFSLTNIRPSPLYKYIYPFDEKAISNLALDFTYDYSPPLRGGDEGEGGNYEEYTMPMRKMVDEWNAVFSRSYLCSFDDGERLFIWDERPVAANPLTVFTGVERLVYAGCDAATDIKGLRREIEDYTGDKWKKKDIEKIMEPMVEAGLMFSEDNKYLSLVVSSSAHYPPSEVKQRFEKYRLELKEKNKQKELLGKVTLTELPKGKKISVDEIKNVKRLRR